MDPRNNDYDLVGADEILEEAPGAEADGMLPPPPKKGLKKQQKIQNTGASVISLSLMTVNVERYINKSLCKRDGLNGTRNHIHKKPALCEWEYHVNGTMALQ